MPSVTVSERGATRIRSGHPWVFAEDIKRAPTPPTADVVTVTDGRGHVLGTALYAAGAQLPLRMLAREEVTVDEAFLRRRLEQALERRTSLLGKADAYRLVHGEADRLPG